MKQRKLLTAVLSAGLVGGAALAASAPAQAEGVCVELELRSSPLDGKSNDRLVCNVMNITEGELDIEVRHKDADDNTIKFADFELGDDEFASSAVRIEGGTPEKLVCEVETTVYYDLEDEGLESIIAQVIQLIVQFPPVRGNLTLRENGRDVASSELKATEIEEGECPI